MMLAGLGLALFYSLALATPTYLSRVQVLVEPVTAEAFVDGAADGDLNMGTEREIVYADRVATLVKERTRWPDRVGDVQGRVGVSLPGDTEILTITYRDRSRLRAQQGAQAYAESYLEVKRQDAIAVRDAIWANAAAALDEVNARLADARERLAAPAGGAQQAQGEGVLESLGAEALPYHDTLAALAAVDVDHPGAVVSPASRPGAAASPKPRINAILGACFGFLVGLVGAVGRDRVDRRLRDRVDLEEQLGAPVLAAVPRRRGRRRAPTVVTMEHPNSPAAEAYRVLRTRILVMAARRGLTTLMVASPTSGDGATAVAANLAVSLTQVGKRVVLLSVDLRGSTLHQYLGLDHGRGLSSVLAGEMRPWETVQEPPGTERLRVFGAGPTPAHPAEVLQPEPMGELLAEQRKTADFIILEAAPVLESADSLALAPLVDGIVVVAAAEHTGRDQVAQVREQFDQVGGEIVGAVLSNARPR